MQACYVMTKQVVTVSLDTEVSDIVSLLLEKHVSALPVVYSEGKVLGLVSEGDLIRRSEAGTERHRSWWLNFMLGPSDLAKEYTKTHGVHARDMPVGFRHVSEPGPNLEWVLGDIKPQHTHPPTVGPNESEECS